VRVARIIERVDCGVFREFVYHLQADELAGSDREKLLDHVDDCPACRRYLEVEDSFLLGLRTRLVAEKAPTGLEARIRGALDLEAPRVGRPAAWLRSPAVSALAAAVLLAVLLVPALGRAGLARARVLHVTRTVTVVDHDCDAAGKTIAEQRACRDARHLNVLKVGDHTYWNIVLDRPIARDIVFEWQMRGRPMVVEANLYPDLETVRLIRVRGVDL
jgi:hypothetical protein